LAEKYSDYVDGSYFKFKISIIIVESSADRSCCYDNCSAHPGFDTNIYGIVGSECGADIQGGTESAG
jgi:hypothetical protein